MSKTRGKESPNTMKQSEKVKARRGIRDSNPDSSVILEADMNWERTELEEHDKKYKSTSNISFSEEDTTNSSISDESSSNLPPSPLTRQLTPKINKRRPTQAQEVQENRKGNKINYVLIILTFGAVIIAMAWTLNPQILPALAIKLRNQTPKICPNQTLNSLSPEIQEAVISGINEILVFNRPSVLTFIYSEKSEENIDATLNKVLNYATCMLNNGDGFVDIKRDEFTAPEVIADWGKLTTRYENKLRERHVMLVRHLEQVPGEVAMAFHFLCDQYVPIVEKLLVLFTLQYDRNTIKGSQYNVVESVLSAKWKNQIKRDSIEPLINRVSNIILKL